MSLYWHTLDDFLRMGGYGLFVWGACLPALGLWVAEALLARRRLARALPPPPPQPSASDR